MLYSPNFDSADNATTICRAMQTALALTCDAVFPYLAFNATVYPANFPAVYGFSASASVHGPSGTLSTSWGNLQTVNLLHTLSAAGVVTVPFWTGAAVGSGGGLGTNTCSAWTVATSSASGETGFPSATASSSWQSNAAVTCDNQHALVCGCLT